MAPLLHLLISSLLLFPTKLQSLPRPPLPGDDFRSLIEFKKGIRDDPSGPVLASWNSDQASALSTSGCPGGWQGVTCDNGAVVALALDGLGLSGDLKFSTLAGMRSLRNLTISGNNFTGRIAPVLGSMASLRQLDLSSNQFYGPIPERISDLWGLVHLNLSFNGFTGGFPNGIRNLQQLRVLDLRANRLWGDIGTLLSELRNVEHLDLSNNAFFGGLWMDSWNLASLASTAKFVNLSCNKLSGGFFTSESLQLFRNLEILDVGDNQLRGNLPSFKLLPNLRILRARKNQLYGSLPQDLFGSSMALLELDLSGNSFTGQIFNVSSSTLEVLNLSSNALSGSLPTGIGSCRSVDLSGNMFSGDLACMQNWGANLEVLDLSSNTLSGSLPTFSHFESLTSIKMKDNSLFGVLPQALGSYPRLSTIDLSLNNLTGTILPSLLTSLTLTHLNLSWNHLVGNISLQSLHSIESLVLPSFSQMEFLDLSGNSLSGPLTPDIVVMQKLKFLDLGKNSLYGEIPNEICKLDNLKALDLSMNHFKGKIPEMPQLNLSVFNVSYNDLSGVIPANLRKFPDNSFHPGNMLLVFPGGLTASNSGSRFINDEAQQQHLKSRIRVAVVVGSTGAAVLIIFIFLAVYRIQSQEFCRGNGFREHVSREGAKRGRFAIYRIFRSHIHNAIPSSVSFHHNYLYSSAAIPLPAKKDGETETIELGNSGSKEISSESLNYSAQDLPAVNVGNMSFHGSPLASSLHCNDEHRADQPAILDVLSPDRLVGELFFFDNLLSSTAEDLSLSPAEVLGRSSHGTSYKATLIGGHILTVKWLRGGLVRPKNEFFREVRKIGSIVHPNIRSLRGYYWGPRDEDRLILSDYISGDSLAFHLHESSPRRHPPLSFAQRMKITVDVARGLHHLHHEMGWPHGNLKPANILLTGTDLTAKLTDHCLHRLMAPSGMGAQMLNLGALGYGAPELATARRPSASFNSDMYAFGVVVMELLTRRSAGDIVSGQSGAVDLADWVRMCVRGGRGTECFDRDITGSYSEGQAPRAMEELLAISLRCTLPARERPSIRTICEELCSMAA